MGGNTPQKRTRHEPFTGSGVYQLQRHRVVLPAGIEKLLGWPGVLAAKTLLLVPGPGGVVLLPPEALAEHREVSAQLRGRPFGVEDFGSPAHDLARLEALAWEVTIGRGRRFTLPLPAREMGFVTAVADAPVALVVVGNTLEIWSPDELKERAHADASRWEELKRKARLDAEHR